MPEIPIPKPNTGPSETPRIRTSEPRTVISNNQAKPKESEIKGRVYAKEPTFKEKLRRSFVKEDLKSVRDYIVFDILIPGIKKSVFDMVTGALGQTLGIQLPKSYSSSVFVNNSNNRASSVYRDYTAVASRTRDPIHYHNTVEYDRHRVRDIIFESNEEALSILELMTDICDTNHRVSIFTFYDKAGIREGNPYTNRNWGWRNLNGVCVVPVESDQFESGIGYVIDFPDARPI